MGVDKNIVQIENDEASMKSTFETITNLLGEQFVPSYPIFILSLLQSLNTSIKSYNLNETSYAYCYESLIVLSLMRIGVTSAEIGGIMNLSDLQMKEIIDVSYSAMMQLIVVKGLEPGDVVYLYDAKGTCIYKQTSCSAIVELDVSQLLDGIYIVRIKDCVQKVFVSRKQ